MRITKVALDITDKVARETMQAILRLVNGRIGLGSLADGPDNIDLVWKQVVSPGVADTEFTITHNLNRIPNGYLVVTSDKAGVVYKGVTPWTTTQLFLKCNVATVTLTVIVF